MFRSLAVLLSIAAAPVHVRAAGPASPSPTPAVDQYLISWKMTASGHSLAPSDNSAQFAFEGTQSSASDGQVVVNFDADGKRLSGRILRASLSDELDTKTLPLSIKILCGPISVWDHDHYSLKTIEPMSGTDTPQWMPAPPRKQPDGSWLIDYLFSGSFFEGNPESRFATLHLSAAWRDRFHYEGGNAQLADVVTSGPIHTVCDSPALPAKLRVQSPQIFDLLGHAHRIESIQGFEVPNHFKMTSSTPDLFSKEWKFRVMYGTCSGPGVCGTIPVEVDWKITVRRLGKCHVSGEIPLNDDPVNPDINDEDIEMGVEHGSDSIDPDTGVAALNIRLTCDQVPIKNAKVEVRVEVQKNTGGHTHDAAGRPRGNLNGTTLTDAKPSIQEKTDGDGRIHLTFKPGKAKNHNDLGIAGIYRFTATSVRFPDRKAEVAVEAKVDGLSHLDPDPNYVNDVGAFSHSSGDNATVATKQRLHPFATAFHDAQVVHNQQLAACGASQWPIYPLWVIDVSLPFGGQYDLGPPYGAYWSTPHQTHGRGDGVDFSVHRRSNSATAWPADGFNVSVCDGYKIAPEGWLMIKMYETGLQYGHWDQTDFNAASQPWHLHVNQ